MSCLVGYQVLRLTDGNDMGEGVSQIVMVEPDNGGADLQTGKTHDLPCHARWQYDADDGAAVDTARLQVGLHFPDQRMQLQAVDGMPFSANRVSMEHDLFVGRRTRGPADQLVDQSGAIHLHVYRPAQSAGGSYAPFDHEVDDRAKDLPLLSVGFAFANQGGEFGQVGVVAEMLEIGVHQQPVDRIVAEYRAGMSTAAHQAELYHLFHDGLLVVTPGMKRCQVAWKARVLRIALRIEEALQFVVRELIAACEFGW